MKPLTLQELTAHFPTKVSKEIVDYIDNDVLIYSRYLFTKRVGGIQFGYCTHCKKEYVTDSFKHNEKTACKKCKSLVTVKASGRGRKLMYDKAYFLYYEKSLINPEALIARGFYVSRDYSGDYHKTETKFQTIAMYLFEPGNSQMLRRAYWRDSPWYGQKTISSEARSSMKNVSCHYSRSNIEGAVQGLKHFQYCTWEKYNHGDMVEFFSLAAKYPCVEYLTKLGLGNLIEAKLCGQQTYGVINWRGKTPQKVLRMTTAEIQELRKTGPYGPGAIHYYHRSKREGLGFNLPEARIMCALGEGYYHDELNKLVSLAPLKQIYKYFLKQMDRHYNSASSVLIAWRDYLKDCRELGMDLEKEHVLFPNNLYDAHQKTIEKMKIKTDHSLNVRIAKRVKSLEKYTFQQDGLILIPAKDSIELFREGKALNHCVGRYAQTYAEGKTNLFVIRRLDDPETPFYTMEIIDDKIIQTRGKSNCQPTEEVKSFIEAFAAARLAKKKRKSKAKDIIAQPA